MELVLRREHTVLQGEGAVVVAPLAAADCWRRFTQAAVNAVGIAEL